MKKYYREKFALTEDGANNLVKATILSFIIYLINMLPAIVLMIFAREILEGVVETNSFLCNICHSITCFIRCFS